MAEDSQNDVPQELQNSKAAKEAATENAEVELKNEVKKGEAFLAAIGYISFLCILPLVLLKDSKFGQFHGKQALVLAIVVYFVDTFNVFHMLDFIGIFRVFGPLLSIIYTALKTLVIVYAIYASFGGKYFKIPFIYGMSEKFNINIEK